ncbi:putative inactive purple acid phosphatase 29 [Hibiscus syriacus]|uniref:Inactive purple acid phosphatase 29 n=1 Tax=Hibiscus syriacus TaxID=106335 RepID=A0A6A3AAK1_HIBSY|nr:putative inactive purple acid phosphatase 29 [Hibiscus syriacus]
MSRASSSIFVHINRRKLWVSLSYQGFVVAVALLCLCFVPISASASARPRQQHLTREPPPKLRFSRNGVFKILQVADMHYADGRTTPCEDVLPSQVQGCSDLNTTAFVHRMIEAEKPDFFHWFIVISEFTLKLFACMLGDNIYGFDSKDSAKSMDAAFAPAIASRIPWAAVLGNHDQEGTLSREGVMKHIVGLNHTLSQFILSDMLDGWELHPAVEITRQFQLSLAMVGLNPQQLWFQRTSAKLRRAYMSPPMAQKSSAPGLAYFHIPLPEVASFDSSNFTGVKQEGIGSASVNSGFFTTLVEAGDVKAVFTGHDHINDFCGQLTGIQCYGGGFGYHAYGKAGWSRRSRVVLASLEKMEGGSWGAVKSIKTWKRLDDQHLTAIDGEVLWSKHSAGTRRRKILMALLLDFID